MSRSLDEAKAELEAAQLTLDAALHAWDASVSDLWRASVALTQAQKRVTRAHELLRDALSSSEDKITSFAKQRCPLPGQRTSTVFDARKPDHGWGVRRRARGEN